MALRFLPLLLLITASCSALRLGAGDDPTSLRVVSYNIRHGVGMDGELDLERTAAVLEALRADVILLQEVDERCDRSGGVDQASALGERLGMDPAFAPFMDFGGGRYGLAILSRLPIDSSEVITLPPGQREPRSALAVVVRKGRQPVRVVNAHLDWLEDDTERFAQATHLSDAIAAMDPTIPTVFGGDLNDAPKSRTVLAFERAELPWHARFRRIGPFGYTFPSDEPARSIDHFLVAPSNLWSTAEVQVVREPMASDHRPIVADLVP
ncbi:Endonuclease/Exonuclease/phosphatase family protein [Planctomycetes bacterium Poly30]|uniref:Endonuclease/Exonuclease/phosphatase family protein n=1 Tax=Saltatorellus ferox TaxID=2528018 RepID=A0A518EY21_9BACT|nr:Endonuclease/Exonuclease/phosphatase family protein [Planctomycetes bacterium Poly30]